MLNGITGGRYITVTGGNATTYVGKSYNSNTFMQGDMHYDLNTQTIKVWDGQAWQSMVGSSATVELDSEAHELLNWARRKMGEEERIKELAKTNPALQDAVEALQRAQEQVKIVAALVQE